MRPLSTDPIAVGGEARGISGDGRIIVGKTTLPGIGAFIWDEEHGIRSLQTVLVEDYGLEAQLAGWQRLEAAWAISLDGSTIVGSGRNANGDLEAFRVVLPEPGGLLILTSLLAAFSMRRPRR
jgi:uncharacterized membrane protein